MSAAMEMHRTAALACKVGHAVPLGEPHGPRLHSLCVETKHPAPQPSIIHDPGLAARGMLLAATEMNRIHVSTALRSTATRQYSDQDRNPSVLLGSVSPRDRLVCFPLVSPSLSQDTIVDEHAAMRQCAQLDLLQMVFARYAGQERNSLAKKNRMNVDSDLIDEVRGEE